MDGHSDLVWQMFVASAPVQREFAIFCDHQAGNINLEVC